MARRSPSLNLTADPYGVPIRFVTCRADWHTPSEVVDSVGGTQSHGDYLWVGVFDNDMRTLVHELLHAVVRILDHIGHEIKPGQDEPAAYLLDHLYGKLAPVLQRCINATHTGPK